MFRLILILLTDRKKREGQREEVVTSSLLLTNPPPLSPPFLLLFLFFSKLLRGSVRQHASPPPAAVPSYQAAQQQAGRLSPTVPPKESLNRCCTPRDGIAPHLGACSIPGVKRSCSGLCAVHPQHAQEGGELSSVRPPFLLPFLLSRDWTTGSEEDVTDFLQRLLLDTGHV